MFSAELNIWPCIIWTDLEYSTSHWFLLQLKFFYPVFWPLHNVLDFITFSVNGQSNNQKVIVPWQQESTFLWEKNRMRSYGSFQLSDKSLQRLPVGIFSHDKCISSINVESEQRGEPIKEKIPLHSAVEGLTLKSDIYCCIWDTFHASWWQPWSELKRSDQYIVHAWTRVLLDSTFSFLVWALFKSFMFNMSFVLCIYTIPLLVRCGGIE